MTESAGIKELFSELVFKRNIIEDINKELKRQDELWGNQDHSFAEWIAILGEEFGEACQEVSEIRMSETISDIIDAKHRLDEELIQVIAVCFRIIEKVRFQNANS